MEFGKTRTSFEVEIRSNSFDKQSHTSGTTFVALGDGVEIKSELRRYILMDLIVKVLNNWCNNLYD